MKNLLIYLSFITSSMALSPADCDIEAFSLSKAFVTKENAISCSKISSFQSTVRDISAFFNNAPEVRLIISSQSSNASFDYGETIYIPLQLTFPGKYGGMNFGDPTQTEYILAHEYGHAIFAKLLSENDFYRDMYIVDKEYSNLEFSKKLSISFTEEDESKLIELKEKKNSYNKLRKLLSDYSEFYADVITVYYSNNKETMLNALYYFEMSDQSYQLVLARSFSENFVDISNRIYHEEHASLVLARQFIGRDLWPNSAEDKENHLQLIYTAIEAEVLYRLENEVYKMSPEELNKSLIKRMKMLMAL